MPELQLLAWNIEQGGYDRRHVFDDNPTPKECIPERETAIKKVVNEQRRRGVDTAALVDTYGWRKRYGEDDAIARHLGFNAAAFVALADTRVDQIYGPGAGSTFVTDHPVDQVSPLDLDDRQGIRAIITPGGEPIQIATVYLRDDDEEKRRTQLRAGLANLEDMPTLLVGDLNTLRPTMEGASLPDKIHNLGFRAIVFTLRSLPRKETIDSLMTKLNRERLAAKADYYRRTLTNLNERTVVPELEQHGYRDADPKKQVTFRKLGGVGLGVDYVFYKGVRTNRFQVIPAGGASDHDAMRVKVYLTCQNLQVRRLQTQRSCTSSYVSGGE